MKVYIQRLSKPRGPHRFRILVGPVHPVKATGALAAAVTLVHVDWCHNYTEAVDQASLKSKAFGCPIEELTPTIVKALVW